MSIRYEDPWLTIHVGDCRDVLATLPAESVHCVVTSPPYWGLRDYGTATWDGGDAGCDHKGAPLASSSSSLAGYTSENVQIRTQAMPYRDRCGKCGAGRVDRQLGLEATPEEYVADMVAVFREVRRVLRDDGTLWLNLGDSYASGTGRNDTDAKNLARRSAAYGTGTGSGTGPREFKGMTHPTKPKDLVGIPWRVAFALQADGWYLRSDIIWAKPNPMPESVTDRPTKAHEYLFLLSKASRYFYDAGSVAEEATRAGEWNNATEQHAEYAISRRIKVGPTRNRRTVWTVATQPYPGAHFAVMPEALVEPCILAGCPDQTCSECGAPWQRVVEREVGHGIDDDAGTRGRAGDVATTTPGRKPTCAHDAPTVPGVALDPFGGSGTVAVVAQRHRRRAVLIELNPEYADQSVVRASRSWGQGGRVRRGPKPPPDGSWVAEAAS